MRIKESVRQQLASQLDTDLSPELNFLIKQLKAQDAKLAIDLEELLLLHTERIVDQAFIAGWRCARAPEKLIFEDSPDDEAKELWKTIKSRPVTRRPGTS